MDVRSSIVVLGWGSLLAQPSLREDAPLVTVGVRPGLSDEGGSWLADGPSPARGQWRSDFRATLDNALAPGMPGRDIAKLLAPEPDDYFVLKPKHSAFYGSALELLLSYLGAELIVIAGFAGDICVRFTAQDAFLRDIEIVVASDAVASERAKSNRSALEFMRTQLHASLQRTSAINFTALRHARGSVA